MPNLVAERRPGQLSSDAAICNGSRRRFEAEIIELCVRWYISYRLSYRDLVAMMGERGLEMSHTSTHAEYSSGFEY